MNDAFEEKLRAMVREALVEALGAPKPLDITRDDSGFAVIHDNGIEYELFDEQLTGDKVKFRQMMSSAESPNLAFGFLDINQTSFEWTLAGYDEVDYILKGTWEITINGRKYTGHAGDIMYIPKGTTVTFGSPDHATVFYAAYPANWEELSG